MFLKYLKNCWEFVAGDDQYIENTGDSDLKFLCIVDPAWREENEEVFDIR